MSIIYHKETKVFHLHNDAVSYIMMVLPNGQMGHLYYGKKIHDREDFGDLLETAPRPMSSCTFEGNKAFSLEHIKQELPVYGTGDYRSPAVEVIQENGSRISDFQYHSHHGSRKTGAFGTSCHLCGRFRGGGNPCAESV